MYYNRMNYTTNRQNYTATQRVLILNYDYTLTDTLKMAVRQFCEKENSRKCEENKLCIMITR